MRPKLTLFLGVLAALAILAIVSGTAPAASFTLAPGTCTQTGTVTGSSTGAWSGTGAGRALVRFCRLRAAWRWMRPHDASLSKPARKAVWYAEREVGRNRESRVSAVSRDTSWRWRPR